jgi:hypothetical protein
MMKGYNRDTKVLTISPGDIDNSRENHGYFLPEGRIYRDVWRYSGLTIKEIIFADGTKDELSHDDIRYLESRIRSWTNVTFRSRN